MGFKRAESAMELMARATFAPRQYRRQGIEWSAAVKREGGREPVNFYGTGKTEVEAFNSLWRLVRKDEIERARDRNILILDANVEVQKHIGKLLAEVVAIGEANLISCVGPETASDTSSEIDQKALTVRLSEEKFDVIMINGELGLKLGEKRGEDGQVIAKRIRDGYYGVMNQTSQIFSIFGDYRIEGAEGVISNHLGQKLEKSGVLGILDGK